VSPPSDDIAYTLADLEAAERVVGVRYTVAERQLVLSRLEEQLNRLRRQRRLLDPPNGLAPATVFDPTLGRGATLPAGPGGVPMQPMEPAPNLPRRDVDIAYAPVVHLSQWLRRGALTSRHLTDIYLDRLRRLGPQLECLVTLTDKRAIAEAEAADREIAAGRYRGPLHGIPWGAKDILDTAGIETGWGAEPYRGRTPTEDAVVVRRLRDAGAVLVAKLSVGALAYGDIWYGGQTRNPWNLAEGARGSSAGPAAAVAAGLVGFAIGSETLGSIVAPCMRCGTTGLRPSFGRVPRTGAMALCWSLDKLGPITRAVEDTHLVLDCLNGPDGSDVAARDVPLGRAGRRDASPSAPLAGYRLGYDPRWFDDAQARDLDAQALETARVSGAELVEIQLPDWPYDTLLSILYAEAAAAFEPLTLNDEDDLLTRQDADAWPNMFRRARFIPAIDVVQADRFRRRVTAMMHDTMTGLDALIGPSFADALMLITNFTGQPALTLRIGFAEMAKRETNPALGRVVEEPTQDAKRYRVPYGMTLWGPLDGDAGLVEIGRRLEAALGVRDERPALG